MNIAERLKLIREKTGLNQINFADKIAVKRNVVADIEAGRQKTFPQELPDKIFSTFPELKINELWFLIGKGEITKQDNYIKIPYLKASAGGGYEVEEGNYITISKKEINHGIKPENVLFTEIHGDSMAPEIKDKDTLIINTDLSAVHDGDICIVSYEDKIFCKKLLLNVNQIVLKSLNPDYENIKLMGQEKDMLKIIGKVICQIRKRS